MEEEKTCKHVKSMFLPTLLCASISCLCHNLQKMRVHPSQAATHSPGFVITPLTLKKYLSLWYCLYTHFFSSEEHFSYFDSLALLNIYHLQIICTKNTVILRQCYNPEEFTIGWNIKLWWIDAFGASKFTGHRRSFFDLAQRNLLVLMH